MYRTCSQPSNRKDLKERQEEKKIMKAHWEQCWGCRFWGMVILPVIHSSKQPGLPKHVINYTPIVTVWGSMLCRKWWRKKQTHPLYYLINHTGSRRPVLWPGVWLYCGNIIAFVLMAEMWKVSPVQVIRCRSQFIVVRRFTLIDGHLTDNIGFK